MGPVVDNEYLSRLKPAEFQCLYWVTCNPPRFRKFDSLPAGDAFLSLWSKCEQRFDSSRLFPSPKQYKFACTKFGLSFSSPWSAGIPPTVSQLFIDSSPSRSFVSVYNFLYKHSYFHQSWHMRVVEISNGLLCQELDYSKRSISYALTALRKSRFIRQLWRGRPDPSEDKYLHSCYELPCSSNHVKYWRINLKSSNRRR